MAEGLTEVELGEAYFRPLGEVGNLVRYLNEAAAQGLWLYPDY